MTHVFMRTGDDLGCTYILRHGVLDEKYDILHVFYREL